MEGHDPELDDVARKLRGDEMDEETHEAVLEEQVIAAPVNERRMNRFYDRLRENIHSFLAKNRATAGKTGEFLLLVPDIFILLWRLTKDKRVTGKNKMLLGSGIAYFILPIDLIPEAIVGPLGYADDLVFAVYILNRILMDTDEAVLREHWSGDADILMTIRKVLNSADELVASDVLKQIKKMMK